MNKIKKINEDAWNYLNKWPRESWTKSTFSHRPKLDNICNNACEVFNARIKEVRAKPIITLLEEVRMFVMRTIAKNKVKLASHVGKLPLVVQSILDKIRKESKNWLSIWTGDDEYEKFKVHGYPTNMMVDLGKRLCTCQFWMLTGMPCVHACAALARVNRGPGDFYHKWLTMDTYKDTYAHYINFLPRQNFWEKSESNRYCLQKGHIKRGCPKKRAVDVVTAVKTKFNAQGNAALGSTVDPNTVTPEAINVPLPFANQDAPQVKLLQILHLNLLMFKKLRSTFLNPTTQMHKSLKR
ncbi:uncharacterized protein [Arachis hypogaea]|uniref:uncharacterized protein n=1 Tax=Arachis hypogaea TaxID=3818 RepID=UPI003B217FD9